MPRLRHVQTSRRGPRGNRVAAFRARRRIQTPRARPGTSVRCSLAHAAKVVDSGGCPRSQGTRIEAGCSGIVSRNCARGTWITGDVRADTRLAYEIEAACLLGGQPPGSAGWHMPRSAMPHVGAQGAATRALVCASGTASIARLVHLAPALHARWPVIRVGPLDRARATTRACRPVRSLAERERCHDRSAARSSPRDAGAWNGAGPCARRCANAWRHRRRQRSCVAARTGCRSHHDHM